MKNENRLKREKRKGENRATPAKRRREERKGTG
jgi:hypothetical protein